MLLLAAALSLAHATPAPIAAGPFTVTPVYHGTLLVQHGDTTIWVDPWSKGKLDDRPKADVVLLTDLHPDHLDEAAIAKVRGDGTKVVGPEAVAAKRKEAGQSVDVVVANGQTIEVAGIRVTGVPMYNLERGPEGGGLFHEKGRGNGYILESGDTRVYIAGDTACTPEMKALEGIDLAFVPMNLPYTMTPDEAAPCVAAFRPRKVVPYHYYQSDLGVFQKALAGEAGIEVQVVDFYPGGGPW